MRIWIRKSDLINANYCDHEDCFLARALKRKFPNHYVSVGPYDAKVSKGKKIINYDISGNGHNLLSNYDFFDTKEGFHVNLKEV